MEVCMSASEGLFKNRQVLKSGTRNQTGQTENWLIALLIDIILENNSMLKMIIIFF